MRIAVIGTGKMGTALGARLAAAGHEVRIGSRDAERGRRTAAEVGAAFGGNYDAAAANAEALILAVPWSVARETLTGLGDLAGAILIDVTNPSVRGAGPLLAGSGAEELAADAEGGPVVKAWNTLYSELLRRPGDFEGERATVFVAGDEPAAKAAVAGLVRDLGYDPADAGPLSSSRYLESLAGFMVVLDRLSNGRREHALRVLTRPAPVRPAPTVKERSLA